ncbi:type I-E CRISPR-associated protein Cas7/Cse4/CasC [Anaerobaca lacustris]|uniref:Type I-E CRISPR-associated protein Cas7/Cse4/CasC n=1 Tax=Anaerobaca lacustris TaxID=3044600 RepID=A0AAW6TXY0_9BACT|nr:type I-E CRISPR-associated protein Cas7/Cse4/CasC [Sedimentisphaerales bacterium M17dextr]
MFIQIHMLQSMPPGNLNRDETGQPKKCIFGGVTRGRISSQCLKRSIRRSEHFKTAFGDALADRTTYLPRMVADILREESGADIPDGELDLLMTAIASRFKKEKSQKQPEEPEEENAPEAETSSPVPGGTGQTAQLVFFPPPFAAAIAKLISAFRRTDLRAYQHFIGTLTPKPKKDEKKLLDEKVNELLRDIAKASNSLTVDIGLFGRMTTSDLVVNVEAACQVAHAISTHETVIESDYFTAMDDRKANYTTNQVEKAGAAFLGSGETETFYNASVYYKYLNLDLDALKTHLNLNGQAWPDSEAAKAVGALLTAAALANPSGKQNSFASHGIPEVILVELSNVKRPISYANAFLQAVEGPNHLTCSADALKTYVEAVTPAFAPPDTERYLLAVGHAKTTIGGTTPVETLDKLVEAVSKASVAPRAETTA